MAKIEIKECTSCHKNYLLRITIFSKHKIFDYYCKFCRNGNSIKSHNNKNKSKKCSLDNCDNQHYAKGYCRKHYARVIRYGTTELVQSYLSKDEKRIYPSNRKHDKEKYLIMKFRLDLSTYKKMSKNGCMVCGETPDIPLFIDHDHACCSTRGKTCGNCNRGVVCHKCNTTIGKYENNQIRKDNPLYQKVQQYLKNYKKSKRA